MEGDSFFFLPMPELVVEDDVLSLSGSTFNFRDEEEV